MYLSRILLASAVAGLFVSGAASAESLTQVAIQGRSGIASVPKSANVAATVALSAQGAGVGDRKANAQKRESARYYNASRPTVFGNTVANRPSAED